MNRQFEQSNTSRSSSQTFVKAMPTSSTTESNRPQAHELQQQLQQNSYIDDEDMESDYGEELEASGSKASNWNDTMPFLNDNENDVND